MGDVHAYQYRIGFALDPRKAAKHLQPDLIALAEQHGFELVAIRPEWPVAAQGPWDIILQKARDPAWQKELQDYVAVHPETRLVDSFEAVSVLNNRASMLQSLAGGILLQPPVAGPSIQQHPQMRCSAPRQVTLPKGCSLNEAQHMVAAASLQYPLLAKPFWTNTAAGHGLVLINNAGALAQLVQRSAPAAIPLPVTLHQYVDHGGCMFKVYVLGRATAMHRRASLHVPPSQQDVEQESNGIQALTRVSAYQGPAGEVSCKGVDDLPRWAIDALADELRMRLGLRMFNFDLVRPSPGEPQAGNEPADLLILDVNHWPGFEKLTGYANLMLQFLTDLVAQVP